MQSSGAVCFPSVERVLAESLAFFLPLDILRDRLTHEPMGRAVTRGARAAGWLAGLVLLAGVGCAPRAVPGARRLAPERDVATNRYFQSLRGDTTRLIAFLRDMPKGGDLHNHLGGAVYAESMVGWAAADGLCLNLLTYTLTPPPCSAGGSRPSAALIAQNTELFGEVIDAWSMRHFDYSRRLGPSVCECVAKHRHDEL